MAKYKAFGAKFQLTTTAGSTWTDVGQIASIGAYSMTRETIDSTTHDSTGGFREFLAHLRQVEPFDITLLFDPADSEHTELRDRFISGSDTGDPYRFIFPSNPAVTWEQDAIITGFTVSEEPVDGRLEAVINFTPVGGPNFAAS